MFMNPQLLDDLMARETISNLSDSLSFSEWYGQHVPAMLQAQAS